MNVLGPPWGRLGLYWGRPGAVLCRLGLSWGYLSCPGVVLGRLGLSWGCLVPSWGRLGAVLGPSWGRPGAFLGRPVGCLGCLGAGPGPEPRGWQAYAPQCPRVPCSFICNLDIYIYMKAYSCVIRIYIYIYILKSFCFVQTHAHINVQLV